MAKNNNLKDFVIDIADTIRAKKKTTEKINPQNFSQEIENMLLVEELPIYEGENNLNSPAEEEAEGYLTELLEGTIKQCHDKNIEIIGERTFYICSSLTTANFPKCSYIGSFAFNGCYSLTSISFPQCTSIGSYAFGGCRSLTEANFPKCTSIESNAFYYCDSLTSISFPYCTSIGALAFLYCTKLESIYLNVSSVPTLANTNAFNNTPLSVSTYLGYYGSIYVPSSLYESFINGTNWATYSSRIVSYF